MKKIMVVFGTRPEAIKMCPLVNALKKEHAFQTIVCATGQHKEMLEQVLKIFKVVPEYNFNIMKDGQTLFDITKSVLEGMRAVLENECPDIILVHGDTTTTFAAALAGFYQQIPVAHIEAGLRTYNLKAPYPEEFNRQCAGIMADYHFAPTDIARDNLINEGKNPNTVFVTGNTVIDALKITIQRDYHNEILKWAENARLVLLTVHRRENWGQYLYNIFEAIKQVLDEINDIKIIFPIHKNLQIREVAYKVFGEHARIKIVEPLDVLDFHNLMSKSYLILTDSGGIQEEASALGKPVLVLREVTERPEGIKAGTLKLVGVDKMSIINEFRRLLVDEESYNKMVNVVNPYGDGEASKRIVAILKNVLT